MSHPRPFRFGLQGRTTGPRDEWIAMVRRVEEMGFSSYLALDHFVRGLDPTASLMAAAMVSDRLRIGTLLFDNDFRHPALLAKAAASMDVLSGGRLELGIGAGWLKEEYDQTGIPFDSAGVRIERMVEAVHLIKRIFTEEHPISFAGRHYTVTDLICPPHPVQKPHPPIIIGGGSKRILTVAAQEADIVGITTRARPDGSKDTADNTADLTAEKIGWIRDAAGERFDQIELNVIISGRRGHGRSRGRCRDDRRPARHDTGGGACLSADPDWAPRRDGRATPGAPGAVRLLLHRRHRVQHGQTRPGGRRPRRHLTADTYGFAAANLTPTGRRGAACRSLCASPNPVDSADTVPAILPFSRSRGEGPGMRAMDPPDSSSRANPVSGKWMDLCLRPDLGDEAGEQRAASLRYVNRWSCRDIRRVSPAMNCRAAVTAKSRRPWLVLQES